MNPDPKDLDSLREFFTSHDYFTTTELARLVEKHPSTVRRWRRLCGVPSNLSIDTSAFEPFTPPSQKLPKVEDPKEWDNQEWLEEYYTEKGYGLRTVARIVGRSPTIVRRRLNKYGIEIRAFEETQGIEHPCCDRDWLNKHYVKGELSLRKCAAIAGVNPYTIYNWLTMFDIEIRSLNEAMAITRRGKKHSKKARKKMAPKSRGVRWKPPSKD